MEQHPQKNIFEAKKQNTKSKKTQDASIITPQVEEYETQQTAIFKHKQKRNIFQEQIMMKRNAVLSLINCSSRNNMNHCIMLCNDENEVNINIMPGITNINVEKVQL